MEEKKEIKEQVAEPKANPVAVALKNSAEIIEAMPIGVNVMDFDGKIIQENESAWKMFGVLAGEAIGTLATNYVIEEDVPRVLEAIKECIAKNYYRGFEYTGVRKDGSKFPLIVDGTLLRDAEGNPTSIVITYRDITELKRAQDEVVTSRDYTDNIIKSMIDTLIVVNPEGQIKTINQATLELLSYKEDELIGKPVATIFAEEEEEEVSIFKETGLKKLIEEGTIRDYDMKYRTRKGEVIPVSFSGSVMRNKDGNLVGIVAIARDMREIKRLREKEKEFASAAAAEISRKKAAELEKAYAELQNSKDELVRSEKLAFTGRISASIAHEIRNPLTNISMSVQQLKGLIDSKGSEAKHKHIDIVMRNTERVNYLITELLNSAKPPKLDIQPHNIHRVLEDILESTKTKVRLQKIKVVKKFTFEPSIVEIDKAQIERALLNIVINAIEAMPKGGILTIVTEVDERLFDVKIQDTGRGIPEEDIIKIFDPFFSSKPAGVGLGLTICYGIIVSHGGTIEVESRDEKGSIFTVSLPIS